MTKDQQVEEVLAALDMLVCDNCGKTVTTYQGRGGLYFVHAEVGAYAKCVGMAKVDGKTGIYWKTS